jgi:hypothetical protein
MGKSMCRKSKTDRLRVKEKPAKYFCKDCEADAHKEKHLCKPKKL